MPKNKTLTPPITGQRKPVRLDLSAEEYRVLVAAAKADSRSLASFARAAVMETARELLEQHDIDPGKI